MCFKNFSIQLLAFLWFGLKKQSISMQIIIGQVDRASANEMVDLGSILNRVKPDLIIIDIHSLPA